VGPVGCAKRERERGADAAESGRRSRGERVDCARGEIRPRGLGERRRWPGERKRSLGLRLLGDKGYSRGEEEVMWRERAGRKERESESRRQPERDWVTRGAWVAG
jgi:hypothetical protein